MVLFSIIKNISCCNFFALAGLSRIAVERNSSLSSSTKAGKHSFLTVEANKISLQMC